MKIEYDSAIKRFLLDGRITTRADAIAAHAGQRIDLPKGGPAFATVEADRHDQLLPGSIQRAPQPEPITYEQFRRIFCDMLANALNGGFSLRKAERWVRANIRPGKKRRSVYSLKHDVDQSYQRHDSACYLREADFADVLRRCGHVVKMGTSASKNCVIERF